MADDREAEIRERAYQIWQDEGQPDGKDREHWEQAEKELAEPAKPSPAAKKK